MDLLSAFLWVLGGIGLSLFVFIIGAFLLVFYVLQKLVKPNVRLWLFFGLLALVLLIVPDPLDALTGGVPIIEAVFATGAGIKVLANKK